MGNFLFPQGPQHLASVPVCTIPTPGGPQTHILEPFRGPETTHNERMHAYTRANTLTGQKNPQTSSHHVNHSTWTQAPSVIRVRPQMQIATFHSYTQGSHTKTSTSTGI